MRHHARDAVDQGGQGAAGVGEDDLAVGRDRVECVRQDQVHRRPPRFVRVVEHGLREVRVDQVRVDPVRRVHKHHGLAPVQLGPHAPEVGVPQIVVVAPVAGEQDDPVRVQLVQGIRDLLKHTSGVEEGGHRCEEAVLRRAGIANRRRGLVGGSRK